MEQYQLVIKVFPGSKRVSVKVTDEFNIYLRGEISLIRVFCLFTKTLFIKDNKRLLELDDNLG